MIDKEISSLIGKQLVVHINGKEKSLIVIDWASISSEEGDRFQDLQEYFMDEVCLKKVTDNSWIPIGVLGLTYNPESYAEIGNGGLLLLEHSGQVQHHQNGKTEKVADRFDQLQVSEFREKVDRNQTHREPPYKKNWSQAIAKRKEKQYPAAIEILESLCKELPENLAVASYLAMTHYKNGDMKATLQSADSVLLIEPSYIDALTAKGLALLKSGRIEEATQCAEKIVQQYDPKKITEVGAAKGFALRALIMAKAGDSVNASEDKAKALKIDSIVGFFVDGLDEI